MKPVFDGLNQLYSTRTHAACHQLYGKSFAQKVKNSLQNTVTPPEMLPTCEEPPMRGRNVLPDTHLSLAPLQMRYLSAAASAEPALVGKPKRPRWQKRKGKESAELTLFAGAAASIQSDTSWYGSCQPIGTTQPSLVSPSQIP